MYAATASAPAALRASISSWAARIRCRAASAFLASFGLRPLERGVARSEFLAEVPPLVRLHCRPCRRLDLFERHRCLALLLLLHLRDARPTRVGNRVQVGPVRRARGCEGTGVHAWDRTRGSWASGLLLHPAARSPLRASWIFTMRTQFSSMRKRARPGADGSRRRELAPSAPQWMSDHAASPGWRSEAGEGLASDSDTLTGRPVSTDRSAARTTIARRSASDRSP